MTTLASGSNTQITVNAGQTYLIKSAGPGVVNVLYGPNWTSVLSTIDLDVSDNTQVVGPFQDTVRLAVTSFTGQIEYNLVDQNIQSTLVTLTTAQAARGDIAGFVACGVS